MTFAVLPQSVPVQAPPPDIDRVWTSARVLGVVLLTFWAVAFVWLGADLVTNFERDFFDRYAPRLLSGVWVTLELVAISLLLGGALAFPIAFARIGDNRILSRLASGYIYFFRGTPLLAQAYLVYYGAGQFRPALESINLWWFFNEAYNCAVFIFTLNTAAYQAEILRGAIQSVDKGQWEGGRSLGLDYRTIFRRIILPQALIVALRPLGNEIILMIKGSAIVSVITVFDLMGQTRLAYSRSFDMQVYFWAALVYLAIVEVLGRVWNLLERRLTRHLRREVDQRM